MKLIQTADKIFVEQDDLHKLMDQLRNRAIDSLPSIYGPQIIGYRHPHKPFKPRGCSAHTKAWKRWRRWRRFWTQK